MPHGSAPTLPISNDRLCILRAIDRWQYDGVRFVIGNFDSPEEMSNDGTDPTLRNGSGGIGNTIRLETGIPWCLVAPEMPLHRRSMNHVNAELRHLVGSGYIQCTRQRPDELAAQLDFHRVAGGRGEYIAAHGAAIRIWLDPISDGSLNLLLVSIDGRNLAAIRTDYEQSVYGLSRDGKRLLAIEPCGIPLLPGFHSWSTLADYYKVAAKRRNAFKVRIYRFRDKSDTGWIEVENPRHRDAKYLFEAHAIESIIREFAGVSVE